jgi:hypothetical protein
MMTVDHSVAEMCFQPLGQALDGRRLQDALDAVSRGRSRKSRWGVNSSVDGSILQGSAVGVQ